MSTCLRSQGFRKAGERKWTSFLPTPRLSSKPRRRRSGRWLGRSVDFSCKARIDSALLRPCSSIQQAAKVDVTAMDAVSVADGRYGALLWVAPKDVKKAAALLGASASAAATPV